MNKDELTDWFMNVFWPGYKDLCKTPFVTKWTGGARGEALTKILQIKPAHDLRERIMMAIREHKIHRQKVYQDCGTAQKYNEHVKYNKFYCNRDARTWLHNSGFDDEIPDTVKEKEEEATGGFEICKEPGCNRPLHGPRFDQCSECLHTDPYQPERQAIGERNFPKIEGESNHDRRERIKADGQQKVAGLRAAIRSRK